MLFSTNHTVTVKSLSSGAKRTWGSASSSFRVYINQIQEDMIEGFESMWAFTAYRMMTDGNHSTILPMDKITDENGVVYEVTAKSISNDLTGVHHQYLLSVKNT